MKSWRRAKDRRFSAKYTQNGGPYSRTPIKLQPLLITALEDNCLLGVIECTRNFYLVYVFCYVTSKNAKISKNDNICEKCPGKPYSKLFISASECVSTLNSTFPVRYYRRLPRNQSEIIAQASVKTRLRAKLPKKFPKIVFFSKCVSTISYTYSES